MKNTLLATVLVTILFGACKPNVNPNASPNAAKESQTSQTTTGIKPLVSENAYYHLKGVVGDMPITMDLVKARYENTLSCNGTYYYDKYQVPISLYGAVDGKLRLDEYHNIRDDKETTMFFEGELTDSGFIGTWSDGKKTYNVDLKNVINDEIVRFTQLYFDDSLPNIKKYNIEARKSSTSLSALFPMASTNAEVRAFLEKNILKGILTDSIMQLTNAKTPAQAFEYFRTDLRNEFDTLRNQIGQNDTAVVEFAMHYKSTNVNVVFNQNQRLTLCYDWSSFSGGAHGMYNYTYENYDLKNLKVLQISDIFKEGYAKTLNAELEKSLRKLYNIKPKQRLTAVLFDNKIEHNDNFILTEKAIVFCYNPYEIASYADGVIYLSVQLDNLKTVLK